MTSPQLPPGIRRIGWRRFRAALPVFCCATLACAADPPTPLEPTQPDAPGLTTRGYLGVRLTEICPEVRAQTTLKEGEGLMIGRVAPASPAAACGLQHYDILTKFNDQRILSSAQLITLVENAGPGSQVDLTFLRRGTGNTVKATLTAPPVSPPSTPLDPLPEEMLTSVIRILRDNPAELEAVHRMLHSARKGLDEPAETLKQGSRVTLHDEDGEVEITTMDGQHQVRAWDIAGHLIFEGPCNSPEEHAAVPEELRTRVERLLQECQNPRKRWPLPVPPAAGGIQPPLQDKN